MESHKQYSLRRTLLWKLISFTLLGRILLCKLTNATVLGRTLSHTHIHFSLQEDTPIKLTNNMDTHSLQSQ